MHVYTKYQLDILIISKVTTIFRKNKKWPTNINAALSDIYL